MAEQKVGSKIENGYQILTLKGRLTYDGINDYRDAIKEILEEAEGYVIDLSDIAQIDSTGMGLMVNTAKRFISNKQKMVIVVVDEMIMELFQISKLDQVFNICKSLEEGFKALGDTDEHYWSKVTGY